MWDDLGRPRRWIGTAVLAVLLAGCGGAEPPAPSPPAPSPSPSPSDPFSPSPEPSPIPEPRVGKMPTTVHGDLEPNEIPPETLVPEGADVTGHWFGFTDDGVVILVAWVEPSLDPLRLPYGFAVWRRRAAGSTWRPDLIERRDERDGVRGIDASSTDMTGDGSDDALLFVGLGGSGACGRWTLIDLRSLERTFARRLCDGRIEPGPIGSPGLVITHLVFRAGDAHCCPSARRRTTLTWDGAAWRVADQRTTEL